MTEASSTKDTNHSLQLTWGDAYRQLRELLYPLREDFRGRLLFLLMERLREGGEVTIKTMELHNEGRLDHNVIERLWAALCTIVDLAPLLAQEWAAQATHARIQSTIEWALTNPPALQVRHAA